MTTTNKPRSAKKPTPRPTLGDVLKTLKGDKRERFTLPEVAELLGVDRASVWRWTQSGRRGIPLDWEADWDRAYIRRDALREFLEALQASFNQPRRPRSKRNAKAAARDADAEAKAIAKIG